MIQCKENGKRYKNAKQPYLYEGKWITIVQLAELAGITTLKAQQLLRWGRTPKQVVEFTKKDCS